MVFGLAPLVAHRCGVSAAVLPLLWLVAAGCVYSLRADPTFPAGRLQLAWRGVPARVWATIAMRALLVGAGLAALVAVAFPGRWLVLPLTRPGLWIAILVLYPVFSVYPQELIFRIFLFHRYRPAFGGDWPTLLASAVAFGWVHVVFGTWLAVGLAALGGLLLAETYRRTRSLVLVCAEHALYGQLVFTLGLGEFFYHGRIG